MKIVSIVVLYNNSLREIEEIISSYKNQTYRIHKLILIDNSNEQSTLDENDGFIYYKRMNRNIGSAAGFQVGYEIANMLTFDYIWLNDNDGLPSYNCLEKMIEGNEEKEKCIIIPTKYDSKKKYLLNIETNLENIFEKRIYKNNITSTKIFSTTTTGMLINHKILEEVGFYNVANFSTGYEDLDFVIRCLKRGYYIKKEKYAIYYHPDLKEKYSNKRTMIKINQFLPYNLYHGKSLRQKRSTYSLSFICGKYFHYHNIIITLLMSIIICIAIKMDVRNIFIILRGIKNGILDRNNKLDKDNEKIYKNNEIRNYKKYYEKY